MTTWGLRSCLRTAAFTLIAAACSADDSARPIEAGEGTNQAIASPPRLVTIDDKFLRLESRAPGFAGLYLDESGQLQLNVRVGYTEGALRQFVGGEFPRLGGKAAAARVRQVDHAWSELVALRDTVYSARFDHGGAVIIDLDERIAKLFIGVETVADSIRITAQLAARAVPATAYQVSLHPRPVPRSAAQTLQNQIDPPTGGLMIAPCTLGFNVRYNGVMHFLTNSHCTSTDSFADGVVTGIQFYQPHAGVGGSPYLGPETVDPPFRSQSYWGPLCPANELCRLSDAALVRYDNRVPSGFTIASTSYAGNWQSPGSINYTGQWTVQGEIISNELVVGQILEQMGRVSGWTWGRVTRTCFHHPLIPRNGTMYSLMCQKETDAFNSSGDSGAPIFSLYPAVVTLAGVLWGARFESSTGVLYTWFSPLDYVRNDFSPFYEFRAF